MAELVIKLNDETYKEVIDRTEFDTLNLGIKLIEAVQNGIPFEEELKNIKAEIHSEIYRTSYFNNSGLKRAVDIIDKRISELKGENK